MSTWYRVSHFFGRLDGTVEALRVTGETSSYLLPANGHKCKKLSVHDSHFPTFAEARADFIRRASAALAGAHRQVREAEKLLQNGESMTEPKEPA